jgi:hypothetical protein
MVLIYVILHVDHSPTFVFSRRVFVNSYSSCEMITRSARKLFDAGRTLGSDTLTFFVSVYKATLVPSYTQKEDIKLPPPRRIEVTATSPWLPTSLSIFITRTETRFRHDASERKGLSGRRRKDKQHCDGNERTKRPTEFHPDEKKLGEYDEQCKLHK